MKQSRAQRGPPGTPRPEEADTSPPTRCRGHAVGWRDGPRASAYQAPPAQAAAVLAGQGHVAPEHIRAVAKPILRHRILTSFNAEADQVTTDDIIDELLDSIPVEGTSADEQKQMDAVMR